MITRFFGLSALAIIGLLTACSSSSSTGGGASTPCNENPFECGAGQTCWPKDTAPTFACLNSGSGRDGESCQNLPDSPTCGDGLACLQLSSTGGTCVAYCDPTDTAHGCGSGKSCTTAAIGGLSGPQIHVCVGTSTGGDGGTIHDASAADSSAADSSAADSSAADSSSGDAAAD